MKIVKNLIGICILFLILQQCAVSQEEGTDDAAAAADVDTAAAGDVDTAAEGDVDTAETIPADDPVQVDTEPEDDAVEPETEEATIDEAETADVANPLVCNQSLNDNCIESEHCCQGFECNHENKKCESDGTEIVLNPDDAEVINIDNDIIE